MVNLLRIIENEDGSYSPYSDKELDDDVEQTFDKVVEDNQMLGRVLQLREKMHDLNLRRNIRSNKIQDETDSETPLYSKCVGENRLSYKLLTECMKAPDKNLQIHEHNFENFLNNQIEVGEIALKEKHRTKFNLTSLSSEVNTEESPKPKSLYSTTKGTFSLTKEKYTNNSILKSQLKTQKSTKKDRKESKSDKWSENFTLPNCVKNSDLDIVEPAVAEPITVIGQPITKNEIFGPQGSKSASSPHNGLHFARLVLPDNADCPKNSPDSLKLEENAQEIWQIHESTDRMKNSAACKIGLFNRRHNVDFSCDTEFGVENSSNMQQEVTDFNCYKNTDFEVFGKNFYQLPQFVSNTNAVPPQYAPNEDRMCDFVLGNRISNSTVHHRSPLYGRKSHGTNEKYEPTNNTVLPHIQRTNYNSTPFPNGASQIERLCNDYVENQSDCESGLYNATQSKSMRQLCVNAVSNAGQLIKPSPLNPLRLKMTEDTQDLAEEIKRIGSVTSQESETKVRLQSVKIDDLPPAIKKKQLRCDKCNRKLNITNNYSCRCGKLFCAQHRYSEVHGCKYDYKSEGRIILERQNPLVVAEKLRKI